MSLAWTVATVADAEEVHALLCASDAYQATAEAPAPERSFDTTRRRAAEGAVHVLRDGEGDGDGGGRGRAVAMFTLTWSPPFDPSDATFPPASKPAYVCRLAVAPDLLAGGSIVGAQCFRRAFELAEQGGADVVRVEANPDLERVRAMLDLFGFEQHGAAQSPGGPRRVYLQKALRAH